MIIGITHNGSLISSLGDTLCLTSILEPLYYRYGKLTISTYLNELFHNNPYVDNVIVSGNLDIVLNPCLKYNCNIIGYYGKQLDIDIPSNSTPKLYLTNSEKKYNSDYFDKYKNKKKIAVCLRSGNDCKDLRNYYINDLLKNLIDDGYILLGVGQGFYNNYIDNSFINKTTIREVISIINQCDMYLGVDTGLFHVAAALNKPQVVFFRSNQSSDNRYMNTYYHNSSITCGDNCLTTHLARCNSNIRCMDNFNLNEYFDTIKSII